ncbi:MAG: hypothetical protein V7K67_19835 [Nostoc sp.]
MKKATSQDDHIKYCNNMLGDWGLGIGDWGLGIWDWDWDWDWDWGLRFN